MLSRTRPGSRHRPEPGATPDARRQRCSIQPLAAATSVADANEAGHTAVRGHPEREALRAVAGAGGAAVSSPYSAFGAISEGLPSAMRSVSAMTRDPAS